VASLIHIWILRLAESMCENECQFLFGVIFPFNTTPTSGTRPPTVASPNMKLSIIWTCMFAATANASWWFTKQPSCAVVSGTSEGIAYRYYSRAHGSQTCATSEWNEAIKASLDHYMKALDLDSLPDSTCMPVDYDNEWTGGAWKGYLLYGPEGKVKLAKYCGPGLDFEFKSSSSKSGASGGEL
jgi:hypothetical protein